MAIGISSGRSAGVDTLLAVVRMFDDLRDPDRRATILGQFEAEHAKLAEARKVAEEQAAQEAADLTIKRANAEQAIEHAESAAVDIVELAKDNADTIMANARALAEEKLAAVESERERLAVDRRGVEADRRAAEIDMDDAKSMTASALRDITAAVAKMAEAKKIKAEFEAKAAKLAQAIG